MGMVESVLVRTATIISINKATQARARKKPQPLPRIRQRTRYSKRNKSSAGERDFGLNERFVKVSSARRQPFVCPRDSEEQPERMRTIRMAYCSRSPRPSSANLLPVSNPSLAPALVSLSGPLALISVSTATSQRANGDLANEFLRRWFSARFDPNNTRADLRHPPVCGSRAPSAL